LRGEAAPRREMEWEGWSTSASWGTGVPEVAPCAEEEPEVPRKKPEAPEVSRKEPKAGALRQGRKPPQQEPQTPDAPLLPEVPWPPEEALRS
jgi:hypothetical protein